MKIVRYQDASGSIHHGLQHADDRITRLEGDLFDQPTDTEETADVAKLLAPLVPRDIICIGLNYRKHAVEGGSPIPEFPWCS